MGTALERLHQTLAQRPTSQAPQTHETFQVLKAFDVLEVLEVLFYALLFFVSFFSMPGDHATARLRPVRLAL